MNGFLSGFGPRYTLFKEEWHYWGAQIFWKFDGFWMPRLECLHSVRTHETHPIQLSCPDVAMPMWGMQWILQSWSPPRGKQMFIPLPWGYIAALGHWIGLACHFNPGATVLVSMIARHLHSSRISPLPLSQLATVTLEPGSPYKCHITQTTGCPLHFVAFISFDRHQTIKTKWKDQILLQKKMLKNW